MSRPAVVGVLVAIIAIIAIGATALGASLAPSSQPRAGANAAPVIEPAGPPAAVPGDALPAPPGTTDRMSVGDDERQGNAGSGGASEILALTNGNQAISADGRFVAFASTATNLVPGTDTPNGGLFRRDRQLGTTIAIPWLQGGPFPPNVIAAEPSISANGSVIAFTAIVTDRQDPPVAAEPYVMVWDQATNVTDVVSFDDTGRRAFGYQPSISADGNHIAYTRWAIPNPDTTPPALSDLIITAPAPNSADGNYYVFGPSAPCTPHAATIRVTATDASGVASVTLFYWPGGSGVMSVPMNLIGSNTWEATFNVLDPWDTGLINYWVQAQDTVGNLSPSFNHSNAYELIKGTCLL
jgi:hypothetical protein